MLWRVRTGTPWRDLPADFGNWNSIFKRFRRWAERGVFEQIFDRLSSDWDFEYAMVHGTIVGVPPVIEGLEFDAFLADIAFDVDWLREEIDKRGANVVIPPKGNRKTEIFFDKEVYK